MRLKVWGKTLLNVYDCLFNLANEIDEIIEKFALNSCNFYGFSRTFQDMQKIIDLSERKKTMVNIKVMVEKVLLDLDDVSCKILTLKFIDKMSHDMIYSALNLKRRTYFRKYNEAVSAFSSKLLAHGYDESFIVKLIKNENWILYLFNEYYEKEVSCKKEPEISNENIFNLAIHNFKLNRKYSYI